MNALFDAFRSLGVIRLTFMAAVAAGLVAFFIFLTGRLTTGEMVLLYGDLEPSDASEIINKLEGMNIPYQLGGSGTTIMVPSQNVLRLRMSMAEDGLPTGGSVGYEIFDKTESLGTTNFVQNINRLRALEGELSTTIGTIQGVKAARVHLVLPQRQLFNRQQDKPSASVVIKMRGSKRLQKNQVAAIQHLVAAAVPGLTPERISLVDSQGNLLARGSNGEGETANTADSDEARAAYESELARTIEGLLEQSIGLGKVRAKVTAIMDFDRITTQSEVYDPDGQVVRSTQSIEESADSADGSQTDAVTVGAGLPGATEQFGAGPLNQTKSERVEETVNYEISRTVTNHVKETGTVRQLSVAVLVDGIYDTNADGETTYAPRSDEEVEKLTKFVRSAVGYDEERGDTVEVISMPFAQIDTSWEDQYTPPLFGLEKQDYFRIAEIMILTIVALLVILLVVRPLVARTLEALPKPQPPGAQPKNALLANNAATTAALAAPENQAQGGAHVEVGAEAESMIDINQVEGRVRASSMKKITEIVEKHPDETVSIIRNWMYQEI